MARWSEAFDVRGRRVAQILVGRGDFDSRQRYLNIRNCVAALLERGVVPIVNENDTVATEEISLGDNDVLAAKLAVAVAADALVILTTAPGVLDGDDRVVTEASTTQQLAGLVRREKSRQGRGGMGTKVEAARIASLSGIPTVIAPGRPAHNLAEILAGMPLGTHVHGARARHAARRLWISMSATPAGAIEIDEGAAAAITRRGASLLAKGVRGVTGRFEVGDVLLIRDHQGREIGRGLTNLSADELRQVVGRDSHEFAGILGRQAHEEVIHRDNLAMT
ncbi:MAG: glutamate 5-kinase [Phycisphaerales bacterium]|nr:glutamate 5-kinase [Phycisphaerales bacterium]